MTATQEVFRVGHTLLASLFSATALLSTESMLACGQTSGQQAEWPEYSDIAVSGRCYISCLGGN